jgi:hypothetical protein
MVFLLLGGAATKAGWAAAPPSVPPLPRSSLFELTRQSDLVVVVSPWAAPRRGDRVRAAEVVAGGRSARTVDAVHFDKLRTGLLRSVSGDRQRGFREFGEAVLFLKKHDGRWWIVETIPRGRYANGCVWIRNDRVFWYERRPGRNGPELVERSPQDAAKGRAWREKMTRDELLDGIRGWWADLERLREIHRLEQPIDRLRALRAFIHPSTQPAHSPESIELATRAYREVALRVDAMRQGKEPKPPRVSAWQFVEKSPPPLVLRALDNVSSSNATARANGLRQLTTMAAVPDVSVAARKALDDTSPDVRLAAGMVLSDYADASSSQTLVQRFRQVDWKDIQLRRVLLVALATCEEPDAVEELILTLQTPDDPLRFDAVYLLFWLSGYTPKGDMNSPTYRSAGWWGRWYAKRYGRELRRRPWDYKRLVALLRRSPRSIAAMPPDELELIPDRTVNRILREVGETDTRRRGYWCNLLLNIWGAGALSENQKSTLLDALGRITIEGRARFPLGSTARIHMTSAWPSGVRPPQTLRFASTSRVVVDGEPTGRPYRSRYPLPYVPQFTPTDYGPGKHRFHVETEYSIRNGKATFSKTVRSPDQEFEVLLPGEDCGLERKTDPELDTLVERTFRFVVDTTAFDEPGEAGGNGGDSDPASRPLRVPRSGGGQLEIHGRHRWKLAAPLPLDLAFETEYEMLDFNQFLPGPALYVPKGSTPSGEFRPVDYGYRLRALRQPGTYRFRVHLTPSRDVALMQPDSEVYWDGYILVSPEMAIRITEVLPENK